MRLDDDPTEIKSQTISPGLALTRLVNPVEGFREVGQMLTWDAFTMILYADTPFPLCYAAADLDGGCGLRCMSQTILQQVFYQQPNAHRIQLDGRLSFSCSQLMAAVEKCC